MRTGLALAIVVAIAAGVVFYVTRPPAPIVMDLPALVARDLGAVGSRSLPLATQSTDPAAIAGYLNASPSRPPVRVIAIDAATAPLEGAVLHDLDGHSSALYSYRSAIGQRIVVQAYAGRATDWPAPEQTRDHRDTAFRVYRRDAVTIVCWQEGPLVYALASDLPEAEVMQLAFAQAPASR